jgi:ankyrin repeat protein
MSQQASLYTDLAVLRPDETCGFLLTNESFIKWYHATEPQQLVIIGEMGCGKSVAMAFLQQHLKKRNDQLPSPKICGYYCRDDGTRKDVQIFAVLILSLLDQLPGLKKQFIADYRQAQLDGNYDPAADPKILEDLLQRMLEGIDRPIFFIIDGLDECDRSSQNNLLRLLKTLSQRISGFKSVVSSRPKEDILEQLGETFRIEIGPDAERDALIVESAVEKQLSHLSTNVKALVIKELSPRACGSAIWTSMTVKLIQALEIRRLDPMQIFLQEMPLPTKLSTLYNSLLSQSTSNTTENEYDARTALKLLCICRRPLSILELTWAVTLNAARYISTVNELSKRVDCQRVMSLITPFINRVNFNDLKRYQVRLLHQSMKEFILKEWTSDQPFPRDSKMEESDIFSFDQRSQSLESFFLGICTRYLLLDEICSEVLFSDEQLAIAELPQDIDLFNDNEGSVEYDPYCSWESWEESMIRFDPNERGFGEFFVYASSHWLDHFGAITVEPFPSLVGVENICQAGSTRLHNWTQQNCRPGCTITPRYQFDSSLYDPLSITSLYGSEAMLQNLLENSDFDKMKYLQEPAMAAADQILRWGDVSRLKIIFFYKTLGYQLQNLDFFLLIMKRWYEPSKRWNKPGINRQNWEILFDLVDCIADKMVREKWGKDLLCAAARAGCVPMIQRLIRAAQKIIDLQSEMLRGIEENFEDTTLYVAIRTGQISIIDFLIGAGADLKVRDQGGNTPLHLAAEGGYTNITRLLLNGSDKDAKNHAGKTALQIATERRNSDLVKVLQT